MERGLSTLDPTEAAMKHPLDFLPHNYLKPLFITFLFLTLILFAVFRILDQSLRTDTAPNGIVSFELASTAHRAQAIIDMWTGRTLIYTDGENSTAITLPPGKPFSYNAVPIIYAAFGLGIDYLFMPVYALTLAVGTLLAAQKHTGLIKSLAALAGYGSFTAALFDAVENYALFQVLLGVYETGYPALAAFCAIVKFGLILFGILACLAGWLLPRKQE
jgi:hypothetical protein